MLILCKVNEDDTITLLCIAETEQELAHKLDINLTDPALLPLLFQTMYGVNPTCTWGNTREFKTYLQIIQCDAEYILWYNKEYIFYGKDFNSLVDMSSTEIGDLFPLCDMCSEPRECWCSECEACKALDNCPCNEEKYGTLEQFVEHLRKVTAKYGTTCTLYSQSETLCVL